MKHSAIRQTIIDSASDLFYNNGYNLTGINEVIKEAGIAKATLYSHFKSKDELCTAYLRHKHGTFLEAFDTYVNDVQKGKKRIMAIFDFLKEFYESEGFNGCWCINTISEIPKEKIELRREIKNQKNEFREVVLNVVKDSLPELKPKKRKELSNQIYLLYEGAVSESFLHNEAWPIESAQSICKSLLG